MNKISKFTYTILVMLVTAGLMTAGFSYGFAKASADKFNVETAEIKNKKQAEEEKIENTAENSKEVAVNAEAKEKSKQSELGVTKDIEVTYTDYYTKCKHTVVSKINIFGTTIEALKKKLLEDNEKKGYTLVGETEDTLSYKKVFNQYCPDHYMVILEDDEIVIYMLASEGIKVEYQRLSTPITKINEELLEKLKTGVKIDSRNDLYSLIEEIES